MRVRSRIAAGLMLLVLTAAGCADSSANPSSPATSGSSSTSSEHTGGPSVQVELPVPSPGDVVVAFGDVWVQSGKDLWRVSPSGLVLDTFSNVSDGSGLAYMGVGGGGYRTLAAGFDSLWSLTRGSLLRLDPSDGHILASIPMPGDGLGSIAVGEGAVWVACCDSGPALLLRIDPVANDVSNRLDTGQSIASLAVGAGYVWVLGIGEVPFLDKVDPRTLQVLDSVATSARGAVAAGSTSVWVMDHGPGLDRIDASSGTIAHTYQVHGPMMAIAAFGSDVFVNAGNLLRVMGSSKHPETVADIAKPSIANAGIAVDASGDHPVVWLTEPADDTLVAVRL
jgi:hypothetical protein